MTFNPLPILVVSTIELFFHLWIHPCPIDNLVLSSSLCLNCLPIYSLPTALCLHIHHHHHCPDLCLKQNAPNYLKLPLCCWFHPVSANFFTSSDRLILCHPWLCFPFLNTHSLRLSVLLYTSHDLWNSISSLFSWMENHSPMLSFQSLLPAFCPLKANCNKILGSVKKSCFN